MERSAAWDTCSAKDFFDTAGIRTTAAYIDFKDRIPKNDAVVVRKLKQAGAIIIGKTNMHELGMGTTSLVSYFGAVHNPWNTAYIAGGSSGGSAAAVAAGLCYATIDTDAAGSCRLPASCCGVTGFKPTFGLISGKGILEGEEADEVILKVNHVCITTRYAEDTAIVLKAVAEQEQSINLDHKIKPTIGFVTNYQASEAVNIVYLKAKQMLSSQGYEGIDIEVPFKTASFTITTIDQDRKTISAQLFNGADVLVLPTVTEPTPDIKTAEASGPLGVSGDNTFFANYFGLPAISVPAGFDQNGMPLGFQIVGPKGGEAIVLALANAYQQITKWHEKHPSLS